jgi:hypothetical protein
MNNQDAEAAIISENAETLMFEVVIMTWLDVRKSKISKALQIWIKYFRVQVTDA